MSTAQPSCLEYDITGPADKLPNRQPAIHFHIPEFRILFAFVFVLLVGFGYQGSAHAATSYNCGPGGIVQGHPHCYSIARWNGAPGAFTEIFTNGIFAGSSNSNDAFVTNEMWFGDGGNSWVEVGLQNSESVQGGNEYMFWADKRPGHTFAVHTGDTLQSGDFGKYASFEILQIAPNTYSVAGFGLPGTSISGTSIDNSMPLNDITIGGEVDETNKTSSSSASAPRNGYIDNQWYNPNSGTWEFQNNSGIFTGLTGGSPNPWHVYSNNGWVSFPNGASNSGGHFQTCLAGFNNGC